MSPALAAYPDPMTPTEVATALRLGKSTVFKLLKEGQIRHQRVGDPRSKRLRILIYKGDLERWIEAGKSGT